MAVSVVMPWAPGCEHRRRARRWVIERWILTFPEWRLRIAELPERWTDTEGGFCKAWGVMPVVEQLPDDEIVIVADADVWGGWPMEAVARVQGGLAGWAVPHRQLRRLSEESTAKVLAGERWQGLWQAPDLAEKIRVGVPGGGMVIARADTIKAVPLDPRFIGWGQEDHAWGAALRTIAGEPWRPKNIAPMVHLWHPPADRINRFWGSRKGQQHYRRYLQAEGNVDAMTDLIGEIDRGWARAPEPAA